MPKHRLSPEEIKAAADRAQGQPSDDGDATSVHELGRPPSYKPEYALQAQKLCELGATDVEIADFFDVSGRTITRWKGKYEDFCRALKSGKEVSDDRVERSLYHRATGYSYDAVKIFCSKDGTVTKVPYREHCAPDTTACIFWLKNRRQAAWRDVHKHEHGAPGEFDGLTADELRDRLRREAEAIGEGSIASALAGGTSEPRSKLN